MSAQKLIDECNEEVRATINPGLISEYLSSKPHDLPDTLTVKEAIERLEEWQDDNKKSREHTMYMDIEADINIEVDIEFNDVREYAFYTDKNFEEVEEMCIERGMNIDDPLIIETIHDEMKLEICRKAMAKYTLDQLERRIGEDWL